MNNSVNEGSDIPSYMDVATALKRLLMEVDDDCPLDYRSPSLLAAMELSRDYINKIAYAISVGSTIGQESINDKAQTSE